MTSSSRCRARRARGLVATLALGAVCVAAVAQADDDAGSFENALQAYRDNHWHDAFAAFARLADGGHPEAARVALQMWTWGPRLYGVEFGASPQQLDRWRQRRLVASHGEPRATKEAP